MKVTLQLAVLLVLLVLSVAGSVVFFTATNPQGAPFATLISGYALLMVLAYSLFSLLGYFFRRTIGKKTERIFALHTAKRQALWLSLVAIVGLWMQSQGLLSVWTALPLLVVFIFIEYYAVSK